MLSKIGAVCASAALVLSIAPIGHALADDTAPCGDVTLVFARGSGQGLDDDEARRFFKTIGDDRIGGDVRVTSYELGKAEQGGAKYPAVGIGTDSAQHFKNLIEADASWTSIAGGNYNDSVSKGVTEATAYLSARAARCVGEHFVLGGYSQGAQVMGNALAKLERGVRDRIAYVALFGDPKLYLPEGKGILPAACRGGEMSPWRRGNVSCFTDNGILEARIPYVPTDIEGRTGSWCDREDPICNNNPADFVGSSHGNYANEGNGIDEAAREAVIALEGRLPGHADDLDTSIIIIGVGTTGVDVAFIIDTTGSMTEDIDAARESARSLATAITTLRGRVALTEYRDAGDPFVAAVRSPLSSDISRFESALAPLTADGGGDTPEALLTALMTTFNVLDWKPGATKAAVVLTDAGYHDPDVANGYTLAQVAARALAIDPVNVYPVVPSSLSPSYTALAEQTAGKVVPNTGDTQRALLDAITQIRARPTALLVVDEFWAAPGTAVAFDASRSYDADSSITSYEWDFTGDGTIDETTTSPTVNHTYTGPFEGTAEVRVKSADGGVANAIATMHINASGLSGKVPAAPTNLKASVVDVDAAHRKAHLTWTPGAGGGSVAAWRIYDNDRRLLGHIDGSKTATDIVGLPNQAITLKLEAANGYGSSAAISVDIAARDGGTPSPEPSGPSPTSTPTPTPTPSNSVTEPLPGSGELGRTGTDVVRLIFIGAALVIVGVAVLLVVRRRRYRRQLAE